MSTAVAFLEEWRDLMRGRGHTVLETAGWRTRDAEPGRGYDPTRMFLEHHDASTVLAGNWGALGYVTANKLSQLVFSRDGQAMIVAAGITWHAGVGGPFADIPTNQGNWYSLAVEVANSGSEPYAPELTRLIVDAEACWCIVAERQADRVRGHKEWATPWGRKTDPSIDMNQRRAAVAAAISTPTPQEEEMASADVTKLLALADASNRALAHMRIVIADKRTGMVVRLATMQGQLAGLTEAVTQLSQVGGGQVDTAAINAAADRAAREAIAELGEVLAAVDGGENAASGA